MTAPLTPGTHTVIVDARLLESGQPLFHWHEDNVILGIQPLAFRPDGYVEFRVMVGVKKATTTSIDKEPHGTP